MAELRDQSGQEPGGLLKRLLPHKEISHRSERNERLCVAETLVSMASGLMPTLDWSQKPLASLKSELIQRRTTDMETLKEELSSYLSNRDWQENLFQDLYQDALIELQTHANAQGLLPDGTPITRQAQFVASIRTGEKSKRWFHSQSRQKVRKLSAWFWRQLSERTGKQFHVSYEKFDPYIGRSPEKRLAALFTDHTREVGIMGETGFDIPMLTMEKKGSSRSFTSGQAGASDIHMTHIIGTRASKKNPPIYRVVSEGVLGETAQPRQITALDLGISINEYFTGDGVETATPNEEPWNAIIVRLD